MARTQNILVAGLAGLIFGLGLTISGMVNPEKVLGFLDIFGAWDPSLAFVMLGAMAVTAVGYRLTWRRQAPVYAGAFPDLSNRTIDRRLVGGAVLFGVGWGLVGLCPGPAIASVSLGGPAAWLFVAAMVGGMGLHEVVQRAGRGR